MARSDFKFHVIKRVRYAEIDAQAVVFNSRYLEYFDIGITEYWRAAGVYDRWPGHTSPNSTSRAPRSITRFRSCSMKKSIFACAARASGAAR